jgi:outer membrane biosynthesis protein TonB
MTKKPVKLTKERALREAIRRLALKVLREEEEKKAEEAPEETPEEDPTAATTPPAPEKAPEEAPEEEPAPEEAPEEEEGLGGDFQTAVDMFTRKISLSQDTPSNEDLVDMLSQVAEKFTTTSEERLNLLKGIRNNIVH